MSSYACKDADRKKIVYASELKEIYRNKKYYCPNKECNALLTLRSRNGSKNPYFASLPSHPHIKDCYIKAIGNNNDITIGKDFSIDNFYKLLVSDIQVNNNENNSNTYEHDQRNHNVQNEKNVNENKLNTVSKLFYFCEQHELNFQINDNLKVGDIICDSRNNHFFTKFVKGKKIFLCNFSNKTEPDDKYNHYTYFFNYPTGEDANNKYTLIIKVTSPELAKKIDSKLEKYRYNSMVLMIDCNSNNKYIFGEIFNIKQLAIIK